MLIRAAHLSNLIDYAAFRGMKAEDLLSALSDPSIPLTQSDLMVNHREFIAVFRKMSQHCRDRNLGLHFGSSLNVNALKFITEIALSTTGIHQAIQILNEYLKNSFPLVQIKESKNKGEYILEFEGYLDEWDINNQIKDAVFCFIYREIQLMLPSHLQLRMELPSQGMEVYQKVFRCEISAGVAHKMIFPGKITDSEINQKRIRQIEVLLPKFLQMLNSSKAAPNSFSDQVRAMILRLCDPELPTFEQVAVHFPMSHRSIQRKLKEEGSCFRSILNTIKMELNSYLSKGHKVKTKDIAFIMGYSCSSAYLHAAQKWS